MNEITILHLSDIHFRKKKSKKKHDQNQLFRQDVQQKLIDAVSSHVKETSAPQVVAVTGDIAFSGKKPEYDEALEFFEKLKGILPGETEFLVVPGNHDVDRDEVDEFVEPYYVVKNNLADKLLQNPGQIKKKIHVKFKAFRKFCQQLDSAFYTPKDDYFWVKNYKDKNKPFSFLGLNSAWASQGDQDRFNIALGLPQVLNALGQSKKEKISNRIILMHHPPFNWLRDMETGKTRVELFKNSQLLLHGHVHADDLLVYQNPAGSCICLGANASYTENKDGFIGFQFLEVDFIEKGRGVRVKVWPYYLHEKRNEFVPDRERWPGQEGKPYFVIDTTASSPVEKPISPVPLQIPGDYKMWVREFHSTLPTDQLAKKGEVVLVSLPQVYIPLETANPFYKPRDEKRMNKEMESPVELELSEDAQEESAEPKEPANIDIEELMGRVNCLLLEGKAGMGKTTLIKHLAYSLTHGSGPAALKGYLPILVFLKEFWPIYQIELRNEGDDEINQKFLQGSRGRFLQKEPPGRRRHEGITFELLLGQYFNKIRCPLPIKTVEAFLAKDRALVLLDGLDEVPEVLRPDLVKFIHQFQFQHDKNRWLITGRPHGIEGKGIECFGKNHRKIEPLEEKKAETFISQWFRAVSGQAKGLAELTAHDMISDIRLHEHAVVFTRNPLLLTALCIFYLVGGKRIPDQRADLYDRIVSNLLYRRFHDAKDQEKVNRVREYLMLLAYTMHTRNFKSIDPGEAKEVLKEKYPIMEDESRQEYKNRVETLFNSIEPVCGLLNRLSSGDIEFSHLSFQEFLAAKYMLDMNISYKKYLKNPWWEEALLLYTGLMNLEMKKQSNEVVREMLKKRQTRLQLLGARALRDFQHSKREQSVVSTAVKKLITLMDSNASLEERFEAGEILGVLGDTRIQPPPMVSVEAGEFTMGSDEWEREQPIHRVYLDAFMIGKYPVTNEEFKAFITGNGYKNEALWTHEGWQWREEENIVEPLYCHDRKWNGPNFPVVGISWYEADAYAKWLSQTTGYKFALPSEAQWEKAARGSKGLVYPWGNKFDKNLCNSDEAGLRRTSPVGTFPAGASPYGCMDMAGNVWEWCADWYGEDYYKKSPAKNPQGPSAGSGRVIRGGGWDLGGWRCRAACRFDWYRPAGRDGALGFRLVRAL
ncbi:MAG: SUMF1/EgtB/PvdO family nonheme iron enzyme [Candidatus Aminicenantes bacterium]|nr:MAG: SUMF1/EgtB/PvdO family nonheme iron enzyme [Candidatus Aminicenantes bacterium]